METVSTGGELAVDGWMDGWRSKLTRMIYASEDLYFSVQIFDGVLRGDAFLFDDLDGHLLLRFPVLPQPYCGERTPGVRRPSEVPVGFQTKQQPRSYLPSWVLWTLYLFLKAAKLAAGLSLRPSLHCLMKRAPTPPPPTC